MHILIEGETGTGKELMAQALQKSSARADKPFVIINCAALPIELAESLLFGHEKGAFTGADERKDGYVQKAKGGTLFLDEIGELPLAQQAKLLRFVENGECQRVGSHEIERVDVRIIAATHRNLIHLINAGEFREDLFYRLSVVTLRLPNLYERRSDIPELTKHFLKESAKRNNTAPCTLSSDALNQLKQTPVSLKMPIFEPKQMARLLQNSYRKRKKIRRILSSYRRVSALTLNFYL